ENSDKYLPQQNFSVFSLQRRVFSRSSIGLIFVNRFSLHHVADSIPAVYDAYNRNLGMEFNLASSNNFWTGKAMFLHSFSPGKNADDWTGAAHLQYNSRHWLLLMQEEFVGSQFKADAGYVPRKGYVKLNQVASRLFFPAGGKILSHGPTINLLNYFDEGFHHTDHVNSLTYSFNFRSQSVFSLAFSDEYVKLLFPFDPTNNG